MITYEKLMKRKEFHCIKEIGSRLEERDIKENNPDYKGMVLKDDGSLCSGWLKKTYWFDIYYAFDILDWVRKKRI